MTDKPNDWKIPDSSGSGVDYQSPIELIQGNLQTQIENNCVKAVQSYGFNVDKEELRKALEYDRNQYDKGYAAARKKYESPSGEWIVTERGYECSECGALHRNDDPFCRMCGADMRGGKE